MSSAPPPLFRQAALDAQRSHGIGRIVLVRPVTFSVLATVALVCAFSTLLFFCVGRFTKRAQIQGLLVPDVGLIKVSSPVPAIVLERRVKEGQTIRPGEVLFILGAERSFSRSSGETIPSGLAQEQAMQDRRHSFENELGKLALLSDQQRDQLTARLRSLAAESAHLERQIAVQRERVTSSQDQLHRWQELAVQKFASELALQQHRDEWLDQLGRLQALEQALLQLKRDEGSVASDLAQLTTRAEREQEQIKRANSELAQAQIFSQTQRQIVITAPVGGIATAVTGDVGQVYGSQALLNIVPEGALLQAHLYAPSRAAGFVEAGQTVNLRYAAYPYQKFGQYEGTVLDVSRSPISTQDLPSALVSLSQQLGGESLYRITVKLKSQFVNTYEKSMPLSTGMQLEADVLQDTRRIIEWIFEPLLTLKEKL